MKILMLGWELPPYISGGLGIASDGIASGLTQNGHDLDFFIPKKRKGHADKSFNVVSADKITPDLKRWRKKVKYAETLQEIEIGTRLIPYLPAEIFEIAKEKQIIVEKIEDTTESKLLENVKLTGGYAQSLLDEISKYALLATQYASNKKYEVIHAHDWVTFKAGRMVASETNLPLFVHCHSTEYDRNGNNPQPVVINEEKLGFDAASIIFCVSDQLKKTVAEKYKIYPKKIVVVPNALSIPDLASIAPKKKASKKKVLFIGRFTHQKSPHTFIDIARDLINKGLDCEFSMIGDGYLRSDLEHKVALKNLTNRFDFTGFISQEKVFKKLSAADLLIVPSAAEPFGMVILEAILNKIPVAAAKGSGISEFISSLPQAELWDQYNFVKLAEDLLTNDDLIDKTVSNCLEEAGKLSWQESAKKVAQAYQK